MATISARVSANIYGQVLASPPYVASTEAQAIPRLVTLLTPQVMNFPTSGTLFHPVSPGVRVGNTSNYIYSVIEVLPTGLTNATQGTKWASNQTVSTLNTNSQI